MEQRVLGCLLEKANTTPQAYPLTLNALRSACNQSTNREPIVVYGEAAIDLALVSLRAQGLTRIVYSPSNRAAKHRHVLGEVLELDSAALAVLAILLLRGDQTIGEIKGRSERLHRFDTLASVEATLDHLARRADPLVQLRPRRPGQKDARWTHLLGPTTATADDRVNQSDGEPRSTDPEAGIVTRPIASEAARIQELEAVVSDLTDQVAALRTSIDAMRRELGG